MLDDWGGWEDRQKLLLARPSLLSAVDLIWDENDTMGLLASIN